MDHVAVQKWQSLLQQLDRPDMVAVSAHSHDSAAVFELEKAVEDVNGLRSLPAHVWATLIKKLQVRAALSNADIKSACWHGVSF